MQLAARRRIVIFMCAEHEVNGEWHIGWEEGVCTYEDDYISVIRKKSVHRHPFGTEYAEVDENSPD